MPDPSAARPYREARRWAGWRGMAPATRGPAPQPMTEPQADYLRRLCKEAGESFNPAWTKWQASRRINVLLQQLGKQ